ncbi:MAG: aromatic ring-hydroxylating dioxygenase subunit alpha [Synechococcales bacterium]|nr:aromatic ring-hydroxylating dioxygenase subunit alpha [Synechococcales bacterium]
MTYESSIAPSYPPLNPPSAQPGSPQVIPHPEDCTYSTTDWQILAQYWYPVAMVKEVQTQPIAVTLLDQPLVVWKTQFGISIAADRCPHRGVPLSMGAVQGDALICPYHGLHYNAAGHCNHVPAQTSGLIPPTLCLTQYPVQIAYGLVWTSLLGQPTSIAADLPRFTEWDEPDYQQILPDSVFLATSAGRQLEGFIDVSHFAWVHRGTFGDANNPEVPHYQVKSNDRGVIADYWSTVSNFPKGFQHLAPEEFQWRRLFEVFLPYSARLTVHFPEGGRLCILNVASPISSAKTRMFSPICRNFNQNDDLEPVYEFNRQVFAEDKFMVEAQSPKVLPLGLKDEIHIQADRTSIMYRKGLRKLGLTKG